MDTSNISLSKDVPVYPSDYAGIPERLVNKVVRERDRLSKNQTKGRTSERKRGVAIPQGVSKDQFFKAIDELSGLLGEAHVKINDQPLEDGW